MNLAFCLYRYFPYGGLQRDFLRIAGECIRRGHTVEVYTMHWEGANELKLPIHLVPEKGLQNHTRGQHFAKQVQADLAHKSYDLIVGFNKMPGLDVYYAADTCFQAKARQQHGRWYRFTPRYRHLVAFENAVFAKTSKTEILLISPLQQTEFMTHYQTQKQRFHLLPPGIARDRIAPNNAADIRAALRQKQQLRDEDILLLMVGSGFKTKGLDRTLQGLASLPVELKARTRLFIIGKDHEEPFIRLAKKLGITSQVTFLGGRDDVPQFLLAADLLLHPAYNENTGTVLLEALAAGLPVLTTDVCGYAHYILEAQAGAVLPSPFQQTQFNHQLRDMLLSSQRPQWQEHALAFAKQADIYSMPERTVDILESLRR